MNSMFWKNITLIIRRLQKDSTYTLFNVSGLAVGFSVVIYISLFINHELTYDEFIPSHESIFRVSDKSYALTSPAHLGYLTENLDEIEAKTYLLNSGNFLIGFDGLRMVEPKGYYVTGDFFNVFDYSVAKGSLSRFSTLPNAIVITEAMENKLFGDDSGLNKVITIYQGDEENIFEIIAILKDLPTNTHLSFNMLAHMPNAIFETNQDSWGYTIYHGYVKNKEVYTTQQFQRKVDRIFAERALANNWFPGKKTIEEILTQTKFETPLSLRLDDIYINSNLDSDLKLSGNIDNLWIFGATALFILLLAVTNFVNLATAQSAKKAKEVGVRKTLGSSRSRLVAQFLSESIFLCLIAALLALGLVEFLIPLMKSFLNFEFSFSIISNPISLIVLFILAVVVGVLGGLYPAFYITSFKPAAVIKGRLLVGEGGAFLRNALVVFQFTISIALGIFVYAVQDQLKYSLQKNVGFLKENVVVIDNSLEQLGQNAQKFKIHVQEDSRFVSAGYFNFNMVSMSSTFMAPEKNEYEGDPFRIYYQWTDSSYMSTLGFNLIEGTAFNELSQSDTSVIILNETAVKQLGFSEPIGKRIEFGGSPGNFEIIGVVQDFHHQSFNKKIPPTAFVYSFGVEETMAVRFTAGNISDKLGTLEQIWKQYTLQPFDYRFLDQNLARLFEKEQRLSKIISVFTFLAFFVACLGLLGLAGYLSERKTKEIGIRKALGASIEQIVTLFSGQFIPLILISMVLAVPISYYAIKVWLDNYVYKTELSPFAFFIVCILALLVVLGTVSYHALKSASANPVKALKEE